MYNVDDNIYIYTGLKLDANKKAEQYSKGMIWDVTVGLRDR